MKVNNSVSLSINRYNMVFAQTTNNRDLPQALTNKNSSENASVEAERVMNRVPSNSSYLNKISHSGNNVKQALA